MKILRRLCSALSASYFSRNSRRDGATVGLHTGLIQNRLMAIIRPTAVAAASLLLLSASLALAQTTQSVSLAWDAETDPSVVGYNVHYGTSSNSLKRTNTQAGTAEIWRAFATSPLSQVNVTATLSQSVTSSITVMTFTGADTSGTNGSGAIGATGTGNSSSGAPTASLTTTRNGSWVVGVGVDFDRALNRTAGANQIIVHQDLQNLAPAYDTFWVQMQNAPTPSSGTTVTINDTAPTTDRYDLSICEVLPAS